MDEAQRWWLDPGFIAFDTETTGTSPDSDRIVTAAAVHFREGQPIASRSWLLRVDVPIPPRATEVHGITDEMSQGQGIDQATALAEIQSFLTSSGVALIAFNSSFDVAMLEANLARHGLPALRDTSLRPPVICPYVLDKQFNKYVRGKNQRRLMPTIERYGLSFDEANWHGAEADATITGQLFLAQFDAYEAMRGLSAEQLSEQVDTWREQQDAEFHAWLAAKRAEEGTTSA
jgi:DNA polymerase-3 subunit epsilon